MQATRKSVWGVAAILALAVIVFGPTLTSSYRSCERDPSQQASRFGTFLNCWSTTANVNGSAITAIATVFLVIVTGGLIWVAHQQSKIARQQYVATFRPRVRIRLVMLGKATVGEPMTIHFTVANVGGSVAKKVRCGITFEVPKEAVWTDKDFAIADILNMGQPLEVKRSSTEPRRAEWATKGWGADGAVRIHGYVTYEDDLGIRRRTGFYRFSTADLRRFRLPPDDDIERDYEYED
jgi:hypothetical protein